MSSVVEHLRPFQGQLEQALNAKLDYPKFPLLLRKNGDVDVETDEDFAEQATWLHEPPDPRQPDRRVRYRLRRERVFLAN